MQPVVKWTGSKRGQANRIIKHFPNEIQVFYEPFLGGAHVFAECIKSERISVEKYIGSDILEPLIKIWKSVKTDPLLLYKSYEEKWSKFQDDTDYFYEERRYFNETGDHFSFLFLTRTCYNGLIRFNSDGDFNTSVHIERPGIKPSDLYNVILRWHRLFKTQDVKFKVQDYKELECNSEDWCYLDPPYLDTGEMYQNSLNKEEFYKWLDNLDCGYALSFDGKTESEDQSVFVPEDLYSSHKLLDSSKSSFRKLKEKDERVFESLYVNYKNCNQRSNKFFEFNE